jgi:hypothetical protein
MAAQQTAQTGRREIERMKRRAGETAAGRDGNAAKWSGPTFCAWLFLWFFVSSFTALLDLSSSMMVMNGERYSRTVR